MKSRQLWIGLLVIAISGSIAQAATRAPRGKGTARSTVTARRTARHTTSVRRGRSVVASKRAPVYVTRMAKTMTPGQAAKRVGKPARAARPRPVRWAQAAPPESPAPAPGNQAAPTPPDNAASAMAATMIPAEAEPLMTRALAAYFVMGDEAVRGLRARGWQYGDIATAGNLAVRSRRPFAEIARSYEERRDWMAVAQDVNVPADQIYIASNSPRYVMIRPTPQEMERMQIARMDEAYQRTLEQYRQALAQATPPTPDGRLAEASPAAPGTPGAANAPQPNGNVVPNAAQPNAPATPDAAQPNAAVPPATAVTPPPGQVNPNAPPGATTVDPTRIVTNYESTAITPVERVASARLELAPASSSALLHRVVAQYYALHPATIRDLEAQGWSLADVLVAGNLAHRSEATLEEVIALHQNGEEWRGIAERIGVPAEDVYAPTIANRVEIGDWMQLREMKQNGEREHDRNMRERDRDTGERQRDRDKSERHRNHDTGEQQPADENREK